MKTKKLYAYVAMLAMVLLVLPLHAQRVRDITYNQLPQKAQQFIEKHIPGQVAEKVFINNVVPANPTYNVVMRGRTSFVFDKDGKWTEINGNGNGLPISMLPKKVKKHVEKQYGNTGLAMVTRDDNGGSFKLSNGTELKFDKNGKVTTPDISQWAK